MLYERCWLGYQQIVSSVAEVGGLEGTDGGEDLESWSSGREKAIEFGNSLAGQFTKEGAELESVAFPYLIGCGLAGGDWQSYGAMVSDFARRVGEHGVRVTIVKLPT